MTNKWLISNKSGDFNNIMKIFGVSEILARCLVNKDIVSIDDIERYLNPKIEYLYDPYLMKDLKKACEILHNKIVTKKKIRIIGDYDVDGIISTFILYKTLKRFGANIDYIIPDRVEDGYGINNYMVDTAYEDGIDTILTCDNGISAIEQIKKAKQHGMTVVITDHHDICIEDGQIIIPEADAVVNPKQIDCMYPFKGLCGGAITYKLMLGLIEYFEVSDKEKLIQELLGFSAIATVCDVMDLIDENRIIVKNGLEYLKTNNNIGLNTLFKVCEISIEEVSVYILGFVIGPCLNASGRLDTAVKGLRLLLTDSTEEALELANELKILNELRKSMTIEGVELAIEQIESIPLKEDKVLVVYLPECHESLAGIIAGRIKDKYHRPTIILANSKDIIKGSARSIEEYNIYEELNKCKDLLLKYGGHPLAAGMSLEKNNIDKLRERLNAITDLTDDMLIPTINIDIKLPLSYLTEELIEELEMLEPFGKGNSKPLFAQKDMIIKSMMLLGKKKNVLKLNIINEKNVEIQAIYFGNVDDFFSYMEGKYGKEEVKKMERGRYINAKLTATYYPKVNNYMNNKALQIIIQNYR
ncbi:MAG TPA: single-stranded-DNA-specific exonuclease RecJ [Clostridiales bacterium]|nr:single-stranded-DNA-specific exonuclease RecJ [Clostridiales bacterium]